MSNQLTTVNQEIFIVQCPPVKPVRFAFRAEDLGGAINRADVAAIAEALCRLAEGERRQGIIDLAIALGLEVREL